MNREQLIANPPHNAQAPVTILESRDEKTPELTLISAWGTRWSAVADEGGVWCPWTLRFGVWDAKGFHKDDWKEVES